MAVTSFTAADLRLQHTTNTDCLFLSNIQSNDLQKLFSYPSISDISQNSPPPPQICLTCPRKKRSTAVSCPAPSAKIQLLKAHLDLTDQVAKESSDSTASSHKMHHEGDQSKATIQDHQANPVSSIHIRMMLVKELVTDYRKGPTDCAEPWRASLEGGAQEALGGAEQEIVADIYKHRMQINPLYNQPRFLKGI